MKKTLLSVLAGLTIIGSATALPTPDDRKALCDQNPDTMVWVEKTKACIDINPCESSNNTIKTTYCVSEIDHPNWLRINDLFKDKLDLIVERYVENVLNTKVSNLSVFNGEKKTETEYFAVKTADGGYLVGEIEGVHFSKDICFEAIHLTRRVYGNENDNGGNVYGGYVFSKIPYDSELCEDMGDFASLLANKIIERANHETKCELLWCEKE